MKEWYLCTVKEVLEELGVCGRGGETAAENQWSGREAGTNDFVRHGLTDEQVRSRRERYGENRLREAERKPAWKVFAEQFRDLLVMILIGAAVISMLTDNVESAAVIFAVLVMNAVLGTVQHEKAEKSLESLRALSAPTAKVRRNGMRQEIPSAEVVPGDVMYLEAGDLVVADGRIVECAALKVNESSLTGESDAVEKSAAAVGRASAVPLAERSCMVYSGSLVTAGVGTVIVTETGMDTEIGNIASLMEGTKEKRTPLQISLDRFSSRLAAAIMVICVIVFGLSMYRHMPMLDALLFAVALAVAAIPEALGSIVTIVQAMGTQKMAKEQAIIKDLKAVESLGCVSVICTDKTGTLTRNSMSVEQVAVGGNLFLAGRICPGDRLQHFFLEACALANDAEPAGDAEEKRGLPARPDPPAGSEAGRTGGASADGTVTAELLPAPAAGDATEVALLELSQSGGISVRQLRGRCPRISENPFDSERKMMSAVHRYGDRRILFCKGAPDVLLGKCSQLAVSADRNGGGKSRLGRSVEDEIPETRPMTHADRRLLLEQSETCSGRGLRVIGVAFRVLGEEYRDKTGKNAKEDNMVFLGMAAMMDPPRPESAQAVADAGRAGIRPVMITGDHKVTAMAIARQIGIMRTEPDRASGWKTGAAELESGLKAGMADRASGRKTGTADQTSGRKTGLAGPAGWAGRSGRLDGRTQDLAVTGAELDAMSEQELAENLEQISVYARVTPRHKLRIVRAWQKRGHIVAMTGDGVNDAPALKQADIGVAMGKGGTDVCKDAADMILADDNFATIIKAVANGRNVYRNILGAIQFLLSGNMAGILCVLYTTFLALPLPFAPVHLLFINLLTDSLPAIAIGMEPPERGLLEEPPRDPKQGILTPRFVRDILLQGGLIAVCTLFAYRIGLAGAGRLSEIRGLSDLWLLLRESDVSAGACEAAASTMAFATLTLARLFHGFNCRGRRSLIRLGLFTNRYTVLAFSAGILLLGAVLFVPGLQIMFAAADLSGGQLACVLAFSFFPTFLIQMWRTFKGFVGMMKRKRGAY